MAQGVAYQRPFSPRSQIADQRPDGEISSERMEHQFPDTLLLEDPIGSQPRRLNRDPLSLKSVLQEEVSRPHPRGELLEGDEAAQLVIRVDSPGALVRPLQGLLQDEVVERCG